MIPNTISPPEVAWTLVGLLGMSIHIVLAIVRYFDLRIAARYNKNTEEIRILGITNIRRQVVYSMAQFGMVMLGVLSMTVPPVEREYKAVDIIGSVIFITVEVLLILNGVLDYYDNVRLGHVANYS